MKSHSRKLRLFVAATLTLVLCNSAFAQGPADLTVASPAAAAPTAAAEIPDATAPTAAAKIPDAPMPAPAPAPAQAPSPGSVYPTGGTEGDWRVGISIYGWLPGLHGTVGALGHNAGIHVPFSSLFNALEGIIPIAVEADKKRFLMPVDFLWMKLGVDNGIPIDDVGQAYITTRLTQSIFTPKVGYRLYDGEHLKFDALGGIRYWYVGVNNTLQPAGLSNSRSAGWVDGLGGGRIILPFGGKAAITVAGDAGAGGANLDYQILGLLNYNFTPKWGLAAGWRYLYENYQPTNHEFVYNPTISGVIAGFGYNFGGKPPVPPTASCSALPGQVYAGDPVTVTLTPGGLDPKWSVLYAWSGDGVTGNGATASINTGALNPGTYTVSGSLKEGKPGKEGEKPWQVASCSATYTVKPFEPPTVSCSASPDTLKPGDNSTVTATGVSPQNRPLTYSYSATAGTISGSATTAAFSSAGAPTGAVGITCNVADDKGHSATAQTNVTIVAPPPPIVIHVQELCSISFDMDPKRPTRVNNEAKACLDEVALNLQNQTDARVVLIGESTSAEKMPPAHAKKNAPVVDIAAQRAVNAKAYLVSEKGIDASRVRVATRSEDGQKVKNFLVVPGANFDADVQGTTPVDELVIKVELRKPLGERHHKHAD